MKVQFTEDFTGNLDGSFYGKRHWKEGQVDNIENVQLAEKWIEMGFCKAYYPVVENKVITPKYFQYRIVEKAAGWFDVLDESGVEIEQGRGKKQLAEIKAKYGIK